MQSWSNSFDKIYIVSLIQNRDKRLLKLLDQLELYGVSADVFEATYNDKNGAMGLRDTMIRLFTECLENNYDKVLVLEDDCLFVEDINKYMPLCLQQLPYKFDLFYLGAHVIKPFKKYSENLLILNGALSTHAIVYSKKAIEKILPMFIKQTLTERNITPIDMMLCNKIVIDGNCYISYPFLAKQRNGFSDIQKMEIDYDKYILEGYNKQYQKLYK